eukprot:TRINITY_DN64840_c0_g1_i1.p1 TRINITY_DN64840_c0_g1~~TRINITY_DN64840_c0_g1_i1.p1  ORF type:complete len:557 (+),score=123.03 TRINITY_DN64840_c0_g1_i1:152-1822(+)
MKLSALLLFAPALGACASDSEEAQKRLRAPSSHAEASFLSKGSQLPPGMGPPRPFGRTFRDAPIGNTDWVNNKRKIFVAGNMDPTAPMDEIDGTPEHASVSGARPIEPHSTLDPAIDAPPPMAPDWMLATKIRQRTFPQQPPRGTSGTGQGGGLDNPEGTSPLVDIDKRRLVSKPDQLRPPKGPPVVGGLKEEFLDDASLNYPLQAPKDRLPNGEPEAVAPYDAVPKYVSRYLEQRAVKDQQRANEKRLKEAWKRVDTNMDGVVSSSEFQGELRGRQQKSTEEAERLWEKYHQSEDDFMTEDEYRRLTIAGFDLGSITREDVSSVMSPTGMKGLGFWGAGATCPKSTFVTGAKLKVAKVTKDPAVDDTGVNAVMFRCSDGTQVSTAEGPKGDWTEWQDCPKGQMIYGFRSKGMAPRSGVDNLGITSLRFNCRKPDLSEISSVSFSAKAEADATMGFLNGGAPVDATTEEGWSRALRCAPRDSVCGAQANLVKDTSDDQGVADIRLYCCHAPIDCTEVCTGAKMGIQLVKCKACREAEGISSTVLPPYVKGRETSSK